jgi:hypothetical protein
VASASAPGKSVPDESARGESAFMTGTLAVTAGRGEADLGRAGLGPAAKAFIPARRVGRYPGFLFRRNIPAKEICRPSVQTVPGYYGGYYDEDGRDHATLPGFGKPGGAA